jgi:hypothetical protein
LDSRHVSNWAQILLCFVDDCYNAQTPPETIQKSDSLLDVLKLLGLQSNDNFFILDEKLFDAKIWFLKKITESFGDSEYAKQAQELLAFILNI